MGELGPLDREPRSIRPPFDRYDLVYPDRAAREVALREALAGVELGAYDERIVEWLATWDVPTVGAIVSLLLRARDAGSA